ncbi:hypothetical protein DNHGIG_20960 [Collibacillus ludicampi]|uniref:Flavin reductase like domain-containing protein n=1 Tax=Collibacillus ludicampi TaxID=2771369 RepID=A0AAV4LFF9_9BACL|nr:flavin reductase family protein [Collibacillus ludicampi]GIM46547.1 hypothetical protein DNHGIG_20960 [Collibacillus ludicampi]
MIIFPSEQTRQDNYKLLIGSVLPRPIAFVTSVGKTGIVNAAPFSFFNVIGTEPPLLMFSCMRKQGGIMKDTARNAVEKKEFIVHIVDEANVEKINYTSIDAPEDISEIELAGLTVIPGHIVDVPRIQECKIAMECRLHQHLTLGGHEDAPNADVIIGEVLCFHIADELLDSGRIDVDRLKPVGRLAGTRYTTIGQVFDYPRPTYHNREDFNHEKK